MNTNQIQTNQNKSSVLLPPQNPNSRFRQGNTGEWHKQTSVAFDELADSLALPEVGKDNVNAIPDMWARPLLVEMVLLRQQEKGHPLYEQMKAEWKGMLAAIALKEVQGFKLTATKIDIRRLNVDLFVRSLQALIPDKEKSIYQLEGGANNNPWQEIYVFLLQGKPVGMTSPTTLICPAENADWTGVHWFSDKKLQSPIKPENYLTDDEKIQLWQWLGELQDELDNHQGETTTKIKEVIKEFKNEIDTSLPENDRSERRSPVAHRPRRKEGGFGITTGALKILDKIIKPTQKPSDIKLVSQKVGDADILFIANTEELARQWNSKSPKDIWIWDTNLPAFDEDGFRRKYQGEFLKETDIFLENFYFIQGENQLTNVLLPNGSESLAYEVEEKQQIKEKKITPLLPIQPKMLQYFTAEELSKMVELAEISKGVDSGVKVTLKIPLSGGIYTVTKEYVIKESNAITNTPYIELWPNFRAKGWKEYYAFYYDLKEGESQERSFELILPEPKEVSLHNIKDFKITRLDEFPSYIICQDKAEKVELGLILLKTPPLVGNEAQDKTWIVGIDFGTSFTNVYYQSGNIKQKLTLSAFHLPITAVDPVDAVYDYFMPPVEQKLPLSSVLTAKKAIDRNRPVFDGRLYITPDLLTFNPQQDHIKANLKWDAYSLPYTKLFLKHLALLITAEAASKNVRVIEWTISYPSAFARGQKNLYLVIWQDIINDLTAKTGINHQLLDSAKGKCYRSESLALAHYFAEEEQEDLLYTTCIDMGGGTSDISIWQGNILLHQCSVLLAGRDLFSQFVKNKPQFIEALIKDKDAKEQLVPALNQPNNQNNDNDSFYVKLDAVLISKGEEWLKKNRYANSDNTDLQDILQKSAIGMAGLCYYVGIILQGLRLEDKYTRGRITPLYIGGNASRILHWFADSGTFNKECDAYFLFSRMLSRASGFEDTREDVKLSRNPKSEVARGLVANQRDTRLQGLDDEEENEVFCGEDCLVNDNLISTYARLTLPDNIRKFEVTELRKIEEFLNEFDSALTELKIRSIKPLNRWRNDTEKQNLLERTKRKLENKLLKMTGQKNDIKVEPPFILGLKALLEVLTEE
ncbi:hypothetical protein BCD67_24010 [Oscillatoriales cyanobacterium USR001]|nr:hypothetical protein BCD67_24010 [Oscillatoriales cyanobacterium USR001]